MANDAKVSDGCREVVFRIVIREVDGAPRVVETGVWPVSEPQRPALSKNERNACKEGADAIMREHEHEPSPSMDEYIENRREDAAILRTLASKA
jgi:hypothetical protein